MLSRYQAFFCSMSNFMPIPALAQIQQDLNATPAGVSFAFTAYFLGAGLFALVAGTPTSSLHLFHKCPVYQSG